MAFWLYCPNFCYSYLGPIDEIFYNESFFMDGWGELKLKKLAKVKHATQQILQYQN